MATGEILYAAYGDMRANMAILLDRSVGLGQLATLQGAELCVQTFAEVPDDILDTAPFPASPKSVLSENWDASFMTYAVRKNLNAQTSVSVHSISAEEREILLEEWNLASFGWFYDLSTTAITNSGDVLEVVTDAIDIHQRALPHGPTNAAALPSLNGPRSREVAHVVRQAYLDRITD